MQRVLVKGKIVF